jgi:transposase
LYLILEKAGIEVILSNPSKTKAIAEARLKNDKVDASTLADLLRADLIAPCYVPPSDIGRIRDMIRLRMNLVRDRTRVKNRIHALLDLHEIPKFEGSNQWTQQGVKWLNELELPAVDRMSLNIHLKQLETIEELIDEIQTSIAEQAVENDDIRLLMTIPGLDYYVAMMITSEVGDIERFSSSSKLVSWLGLAPRVSQSGDKCIHGHITKMGSPRVRWALVQTAHIAVRYDDHFR